MDWFERRMVSYALRWAPYGGVPADEVFTRFGIEADEFHSRVIALLARAVADRSMALGEREYLIQVRGRLAGAPIVRPDEN